MTALALTVALTALAWLLVFSFFNLALRRRWFARFTGGFFLSILIAMVGMVLMSASVVGIWGYRAATQMLDHELTVELQDVGRIVEAQIRTDLAWYTTALGNFGGSVAPLVGRGAPAAEYLSNLRAVQTFSSQFVQMTIFDREGRQIATTGDGRAQEQATRVAIAFNLDGKPFVSDAQFSKVYQRQLIQISLPIRSGSGPAIGAVAAWFDVQEELSTLVRTARFNQTGYAVAVDGDGQIIAHPDRSRLNQDVSSYPAVQLARQSDQSGYDHRPERAGSDARVRLSAPGESRHARNSALDSADRSQRRRTAGAAQPVAPRTVARPRARPDRRHRGGPRTHALHPGAAARAGRVRPAHRQR